MTTLTITAKGQVTFNKALLQQMGVGPGDRIDIEPATGGTFIVRPVRREGRRTIEGLIGSLKREGQRPISIEEMDDAIAQSVAEDDARIMAEVRARRS